jgi:DNA-binding NtrC family response regulator
LTTAKAKVLIIEDDESMASVLQDFLEAEGYAVDTAAGAQDGIERARAKSFHVVVTDLHLPDQKEFEGFRVIDELHHSHPHVPIILMTGDTETQHAIEATKRGAFDYFPKPSGEPESAKWRDLIDLIDQAVAVSRLSAAPVETSEAQQRAFVIVGHSRDMQAVYKDIGRLAAKPVNVLILGETGTGKELVARALHEHSERKNHTFVPVNCAAIPETLLESELFGHEPGAFTDAKRRRIGRFEQAHQGTIFLDEIGDMSLATQAKLLRVLQDKVIQRLGSEEEVAVDARVIAATHHDLERDCRDSKFREDLYYRLNVAVIKLPPLRDRREDIPALVRFFLQRHTSKMGMVNSSITEDAIRYLIELGSDKSRPLWPGNVRELENVICKALLLARGHPVSRRDLRDALGRTEQSPPPSKQSVAEYISTLLDQAQRGELDNIEAAVTWDIERELYRQAIDRAKGNQSEAAKWLGVSRPTMREKLKAYGLRALPEGSGA